MDQAEVKRRTEVAKEKALAEVRRGRQEAEMTGRIRKAWAQLDAAVDEIVRLQGTINAATASNDWETVRTFDRDLALEKAKANGKSEILALIMPAPLDTPEAISAEAGKRYQMRVQGKEYETPGIRMVGRTIMDDVVGRPEFT